MLGGLDVDPKHKGAEKLECGVRVSPNSYFREARGGSVALWRQRVLSHFAGASRPSQALGFFVFRAHVAGITSLSKRGLLMVCCCSCVFRLLTQSPNRKDPKSPSTPNLTP